jgi:hypothetical protein
MIAALQVGIVILVVPPTLGTIGMAFIAYRKRNQFRAEDVPDEDVPDLDRKW